MCDGSSPTNTNSNPFLGTTLVLIATDGYDKYRAVTGAVLDNVTGFLCIKYAQYAKLQSLFFTTNGVRAARSDDQGKI